MESSLLSSGEGSTNVARSTRDLMIKLHQVAHDGDMNTLQNIVNSNPGIVTEVFDRRLFKQTPLQLAVEEGHMEVSRILLEQCPEFAREWNSDGLPLHLAVAKGRGNIVKLLLAYGHPEDCFKRDNDGMMPIHFAAIQGRGWVLRELLHHDHQHHHGIVEEHHCTNLLETTVHGSNVLDLCVIYDKFKALKLLVDYSLSKKDDTVLRHQNGVGNTPIHQAVIYKRNKIVRYLLDPSVLGHEGARILNRRGLTPIQLWEQFCITEDFRSIDIRNMLLTAGSHEKKVYRWMMKGENKLGT